MEEEDRKKKRKAWVIALGLIAMGWLALPFIAHYVYKSMKKEKENGKEE